MDLGPLENVAGVLLSEPLYSLLILSIHGGMVSKDRKINDTSQPL
jgi:hypothetical protein